MAPLTLDKETLANFIVEFYAKADASAPLMWFMQYIDEDLKMDFGPIAFEGQAGFEEFYRNLTGNQFNRVHEARNIEVKIDGDTADITFEIHMTSKIWHPPMPKSLPMENTSQLHVILKKSPKTGTPLITYYALTDLLVPAGTVVINGADLFMYKSYAYGPFKFPA